MQKQVGSIVVMQCFTKVILLKALYKEVTGGR